MSNDTMTLWLDVLINDTVVGTGPMPMRSASVTRLIDGSGQFKTDCDASVKGREMLIAGRQVRIWCDIEGVTRLIGEGYISKVGGGGTTLSIAGNDLMEELKWSNTLLGYQINGLTIQAAISGLVSADGWTVEASGAALTGLITLPFDGETRLKALLSVAESSGVHIRVGTNASRVIQVGNFGTSNGVTLFDASSGAGGDEWAGVLESLTIEEQADQISTRILAVGGAFNSGTNITLGDATVSGISTTAGQSGTIYYVADAAAELIYGVRWLFKSYPDIKPLAAGVPAAQAAANQLYAAAVADLAKMSGLRRNYKGKVWGLTTPLKPGDLVRVLYNEPIYQDDGSLWPGGALDELLYINRVEEYAGEGGTWQNVDLSNVNAQRVDAATDVAIAVERSKK